MPYAWKETTPRFQADPDVTWLHTDTATARTCTDEVAAAEWRSTVTIGFWEADDD